jgi:tRNA threonylcarbamoyladenosine biosynthesis protein TsaE
MSQVIYVNSPYETENVGEALCHLLLAQQKERAFVALYGDMGVGKTAFSRGFGRGLGIDRVKSPTYTIVNEHRGTPLPLFHFDMYRIQDSDDLYTIGYDDYLGRNGYILCEWSERIPDDIPEDAISVLIEKTDNLETRKITIGGAEIEYTSP